MKIGDLIIVIGMPGAGKSTLIEHRIRPTVSGVCVEDFHADAFDHSTEVVKSRHFRTVVEALQAGHTCVIADIEFCRESRRKAVELAFSEAVPELRFHFYCFENDQTKCALNARDRGRTNLNEELEKISELSSTYSFPAEFKLLRVITRAEVAAQ